MLRNSEEWMFSCQVRNQSVENGSWPLEGDLPAISLYRLISRSYYSVVSDSSTCMRAPIWISMAARSIWRDALGTLLTGAAVLVVFLSAAGRVRVAVVMAGLQAVCDVSRFKALQKRGWPSGCWRAACWWLRCPPCWERGWSAGSRPGCRPRGSCKEACFWTPVSSVARPTAMPKCRQRLRSGPVGTRPLPCPDGSG